MKKNKNLTGLDQFIDKEIGEKGTRKRIKFDTGYETFKLSVQIHEVSEKKDLTQEQVAELSGTNKSPGNLH